jgi:tetratricopeptide (TPR) repeat protein
VLGHTPIANVSTKHIESPGSESGVPCPELFDKARDLRKRAAALQKHGTISMIEAALALLERLVCECPEPSQLAAAHYQRAACLRMLGRVDEAVGAYRLAFDAERTSQQVHCLAYLEFAELVLADGLSHLFREALATLEEFRPQDQFPIERCRVEIAQTLLLDGLGEHAHARRNARRALATIARRRSALGERGAVIGTGMGLELQERLSRFKTRKRR